MKEKPILFKGEMVRAILEGKKTQTRRIVKPQPDWIESSGRWHYPLPKRVHKPGCSTSVVSASREWFEYLPKDAYHYQPGDLLWVRESFWHKGFEECDPELAGHGSFFYEDGIENISYEPQTSSKWRKRPSIHMPRWASRITLKVTSVRVERLNDISEDDAIAEGASWTDFGKDAYGQQQRGWSHRGATRSSQCLLTAKTSFWNLWESINGADSWSANPWVWVIEFEVQK